jgi:uncharacterized protein YbjT (DUF2867 family)/membrane protease YdiL (CAAX protease family)
MRILVAGASGFVGRHVVAALEARGHEVVGLDRGRRTGASSMRRVRGDVASESVPAPALAGAGAIVNVIGIKRPDGAQTFEAVHVDGTRRLIEAAQAAHVPRFIHVSVVASRPDEDSPYHDTKWRAEQLLRESGLAATILRPSVIYGDGDDMLSHLAKMIRFAVLFPVVGRGESLLQPVDVRDVAEAVTQAIARPETAGRTYDVVGPERVRLRDIVRMVAEALGLPVWIVPTPVVVMRPAVAAMSLFSPFALSTPAQLKMLQDGMVGDPRPAERDLGIQPRSFTIDAVRELTRDTPSLFGLSLRLASSRAQQDALARHRGAFRRAVLIASAAIALLPLLALGVPNVWYRMAASGGIVAGLALWLVPLPWRSLLRVTVRGVLEGAAAAIALYGMGAIIFHLLQTSPTAATQVRALYLWRDAVPRAVAWPLVAFIIACEEIVWRNAVTLPFAARLGPWPGAALAAFVSALAHVSLGVPVLVGAAFGAGLFWSGLVVKTRSAVPALVSHLLWDAAVLFLWPYLR